MAGVMSKTGAWDLGIATPAASVPGSLGLLRVNLAADVGDGEDITRAGTGEGEEGQSSSQEAFAVA